MGILAVIADFVQKKENGFAFHAAHIDPVSQSI
jgi:hypothetical protein